MSWPDSMASRDDKAYKKRLRAADDDGSKSFKIKSLNKRKKKLPKGKKVQVDKDKVSANALYRTSPHHPHLGN